MNRIQSLQRQVISFLEHLTVMTFSDLLAITAIIISLISALGVYIAPILHEHFSKKLKARDEHKKEITKHILKPLIAGINYFIQSEILSFRTTGIYIPSENELQSFINRPFSLNISPAWGSESESNDEWFDDDLYSDFRFHNGELYTKMEDAKNWLNERMPFYVEKRWRFTIAVYDEIESSAKKYVERIVKESGVYSPTESNEMTSVSTKISLLRLMQFDSMSTALESLESRISGKKEIVEAVEKCVSNNGFIQQAAELCGLEQEITKYLEKLRNDINWEATSGAKLQGKCHYLGYNVLES